MGEKGNVVEAVTAAAPGTESVLERVTTTTTQTVVQAGGDLATAVRDKSIDAVAGATVAEARERLHRQDQADDGDDAPTRA